MNDCPYCGAHFVLEAALPVAMIRAQGVMAVFCCGEQQAFAVPGMKIPTGYAQRPKHGRLAAQERRAEMQRRTQKDAVALGAALYGVVP